MNEDLDRLTAPLAALMEWFRDAGLRGAIIGGVAASLRGKPRLTDDVDALVLEADAETLLRSGAKFGFSPRIDDAAEFSRYTRVLLLRYRPGNIDIDISLGALPFEDEVIERSTWIRAGNVRILLASAEDLVIMKAVAGRPRDMMDIENVIAANPHLDVERIRRWVRGVFRCSQHAGDSQQPRGSFETAYALAVRFCCVPQPHPLPSRGRAERLHIQGL